MAKPDNTALREVSDPRLTGRRVAYVALGWGLIVTAGLLINHWFRSGVSGIPWRLLEAAIVLALLACLAGCRSVWTVVEGLGAVRGSALLVVLGLIGIGQIADHARITYPFVPWAMYSRADVSPEYTEYRAVLASGTAIEFPFDSVIPTHAPRSLSHGFNRRVQRANGPHAEPAAQHELERVILSLVEIYNRRHPNEPIRQIEIRSRSIPPHDVEGLRSSVGWHRIRYTVPGRAR